MKYLAIIFIIYLFIKSLYYGNFEINEKENKIGGITIIILSIISLILPILVLLFIY